MKQRLGGRLNNGEALNIKAPPFLNSTPPLYADGAGAKYNTVAGWTQSDQRQSTGEWTKNAK